MLSGGRLLLRDNALFVLVVVMPVATLIAGFDNGGPDTRGGDGVS